MIDTDDQSQPGEQDLIILLGLDGAPVEIPQPESMGVGPNAIYLLGDNSFIGGDDQAFIHYREVIPGLDITQLEVEFSQWFKKLTDYLGQFAAREDGIVYQSVNMLLTGSAAIYLRLYEQFEEFQCARLLLEVINPRSIAIYTKSPDNLGTPFSRSLTHLAGIQNIPVRQLSGDGKVSKTRRNYLSLSYHALMKEMDLLSRSTANRLRDRVKPGSILCVEENSYNIPIYLPAFDELHQGQYPLQPAFLINKSTLLAAIDGLPYPGITPYDGIGIGTLFEYAGRIRSYLRAIDHLFQDIHFREIFDWNGTDVWSLIQKGLHRLLVRLNFKVLWYLISIDRLINRLKPGAVITTYGLSHFRGTVIGLAKYRQIPTLILQNAAIPHQLLWRLLPDHPMLVWGQGTKDFLVSMGAKENQLQVVGPTKYNQPGNDLPEIQRDQEVEKLGFSPHRPLILYTANFTGTWGLHYDWETTRMLARVVTRRPEYQLAITLHPRCTQSIVDKVSRLESDRIKLLRNPDMPRLYRIADVGVTQFSTTAIDASIYRLPIICVLPNNRPDWLGMGKMGAALIARDEAELAEQLKQVLSKTEILEDIYRGQRAYHARYLNSLDDQAGVRIAEQIIEITQHEDAYKKIP